MYYVMGLFLQIILIWLYLILQYLLYIALLIAGWWRGLIQNIETCIPKFETVNLCLKYLELNAPIFGCTEHSQMFRIPVGASINMHTVNWLQPQRWCGDCCIPATRHREGTSLETLTAAGGIGEGARLLLPSPNNPSLHKDRSKFIAFPVHAVVFICLYQFVHLFTPVLVLLCSWLTSEFLQAVKRDRGRSITVLQRHARALAARSPQETSPPFSNTGWSNPHFNISVLGNPEVTHKSFLSLS